MQAYSQGFARVYNRRWAGFSRQIAPLILDFYSATPVGQNNKKVLDLCCGAGHLAVHFLEHDYTVTGIDLSEHMLHYASENARAFLDSGRATFRPGDAVDFKLDEHFGLVVSTYDSLNHLENERSLKSCFRSVHAVCDGYFVFDLNTRFGLKRWSNVHIDDSDEDCFIVTRGFYDGENDKAWMKITGFVKETDGGFERFDETVFNTVFELERVKSALLMIGWKDVYFARIQDLRTPLAEPELEGRVFIVASK